MNKPRIGVVGTGWWATQHHIPSLKAYDGAEVAALADPDATALQRAADTYDVAKTFLDPRELYTSGLVDGVVIAIPHVYHYEHVKAALDAGLHVLIEKPMTLRADHAYDLVTRAEKAGRTLMVGLTYQHTRAAQRLRKAVLGGEIGEVLLTSGLYVSMVEEYYRGRPERYEPVFQFPVTGPAASTYADPEISGGGHGQTQVTHSMGMVLYVTGKRVASVSAVMSNLGLAVDVVDAMSFQFTGGGIGTMAATGSIRPGQDSQQELRYYGTEGYALQDLLAGTLSIHRNDGTVERLDPPLAEDEIYPAERPIRAFADLIADPAAENLSPAGPAADTVAFLEAAYTSASRDGAPVTVASPTL
ncbi:Gfo/Idh/MocA family oxidoreductase [Actinophytocola sp.]|uniref:Gfo/Idh/MocA family protein n=1 Tax=Actinophytocola sp. TaxID=1872138 RepID=UPI002ECFEEAE